MYRKEMQATLHPHCLFSFTATFKSKQTQVILVYFAANKQLGAMLFCRSDLKKKGIASLLESANAVAPTTLPMFED